MVAKGKMALITGPGQNIGKGIAIRLAKQGINVVINGRTAAKLEATKKEIETLDGTAAFLVSDDAAFITGQSIHVNGGEFMG